MARLVRVGYDGKNGHPYTSIGRVLIDQGQIPVERMSLQALQTWLKANAAKAREVMWANKSFVFFKEHAAKDASGPQGVHDITLTPGRSLAVDPSYHALGLPIFVAAPEIKHIPVTIGAKPELFLAQIGRGGARSGTDRLSPADGRARRRFRHQGPERGDIYVGTGETAGKIAGITKHPGNFFVLVPKGQTKGRQPSMAVTSAVSPRAPDASAKPAPVKPAATVAAPAPSRNGPSKDGAAKDVPVKEPPKRSWWRRLIQVQRTRKKHRPTRPCRQAGWRTRKATAAPAPADKPVARQPPASREQGRR